jgi:hypothetical protein
MSASATVSPLKFILRDEDTMDKPPHSHVELAQLAVVVRDLTEAVQIQSRELKRLAVLVEQQTDLRDRPDEVTVAAATLAALRQRTAELVERLEEQIEAA